MEIDNRVMTRITKLKSEFTSESAQNIYYCILIAINLSFNHILLRRIHMCLFFMGLFLYNVF